MPDGKPCAAALYTRISRDRSGDELGVQRQEEDCLALAAHLGWAVAEVYQDNDISASTGKHRPAYERLLRDLAAGRRDGVVAWHPDRLHRRPVELEPYIDLCSTLGIPTATVRSGLLDLSSATGRMVARVVGSMARHESDQKGERISRQRRQALESGRWAGGGRPFGYEADGVTKHPAEARLVEDATRRVIAGDSLRSLVREWNDGGITTTTGRAWVTQSLRKMLLRPRNAGWTGGAEPIARATWPPLVEQREWEALRATLRDPSRRMNTGRLSRVLLGAGLYRCSVCDGPVVSGGNSARGQARYACRVFHTRREAPPIDEYVRAVVTEVLRRDGASLLRPAVDVTAELQQLSALAARANTLAVEWADMGMTPAQFRAANDRLRQETERLSAVVASSTADSTLRGIADSGDPARAFLAADVDRQRMVVGAIITVHIVPSIRGRTGFRPETVIIEPIQPRI